MILVDFEPEPILINYEEKPMPKTVTTEITVEIPDGYELAEPKPRPAKVGELVLSANYDGWGVGKVLDLPSYMPCFILRPIATEKTWERPEWLHPDWDTLKRGENCWKVRQMQAHGVEEWEIIRWELLSGTARACFPDFSNLEPAERIWRIVERGEG